MVLTARCRSMWATPRRCRRVLAAMRRCGDAAARRSCICDVDDLRLGFAVLLRPQCVCGGRAAIGAGRHRALYRVLIAVVGTTMVRTPLIKRAVCRGTLR